MGILLTLTFIVTTATYHQAVWGQKDVTLLADSQSVAEGENVRLRCIYGTEAPIYTTKWHKDDQEFMRYVSDIEPPLSTFPLPVEIVILNHTTVILKNVTSSSTGNYSCEVIIDAPFVVASATTEIVVREPKIHNGIEIKVRPTVTRTNDNVKLLCNHTLSDQVIVKWYRRVDDVLLLLDKSNELSLFDVKPEMSGEYTCEVTTDEPSHLELRSTKYISIKDPVAFSAVTLDMEPSEPKVGDTIRLKCDFDSHNETPYLIKWYKDSYLFYQQRYSLKASKRKLNNKTLKINLKLSDLQEIVLDDVTTEASGTYTCQVNTYNYGNAASRDVLITNPETLGSDTISVAPRCPIKDHDINKENVRIDVEPALIKTGDKVRLRCDFSSLQQPIHSLIWYKDNKEFYKYIPSRQEKLNLTNEHEIFLLNAKPEKSGNYACEVLTDAPLFHKFRTTKYLSMEDFNKTLVNIEPLTPKVGGKLLLKCNYDFHNESLYVVQWYKDSMIFYQYISGSRPSKLSPFLNSSKINLEESNHQQVVLENLTAEASGTYMCQINTLLLVEQFSTQVQLLHQEPIACISGYFQCANTECIPINWKCDGTNDCMDGSDEDIKLCGIQTRCDSGFFKCGYSNCIPIEWQCDGDRDCVDGVDEFPKICNESSNKCNSSQFTCSDSKCIRMRWTCDGEKDCADGSDEDPKLCSKSFKCNSNEFTCGDLNCIPKRWKCNGVKDCTDGLDEHPTVCEKPKCNSEQFKCDESRCIPMRWKCDGEKDCKDGSDEDLKVCRKPSTCSSNQFKCGDLKCIPITWKCDGEKDCTDGSDEDLKVCGKPTTCSSDQFRCDETKCVSIRWKCDGENDCSDGSDEDPMLCSSSITTEKPTCALQYFQCSDSRCIPITWKCDGEKDCTDGLDEDPKVCGKPSKCDSYQFKCGDAKCIPNWWKCDGEKDCGDGSDEDLKLCFSSSSSSSSSITTEKPTCALQYFQCSDSRCIPITWKCDGEKDCTDGLDEDPKVCGKPFTCDSYQFKCGDAKCIPNWWKCDGEKDCSDGSDEDPKLCSSSNSIITEKPTCALQYFQCSDSRCIPITWKCDGEKDCTDGLDEHPKVCGKPPTCSSDQFTCGDSKCISKRLKCDGEKDCTDGLDEDPKVCGKPPTCSSDQFTCGDSKCISKRLRCDGEKDCTDGLDEDPKVCGKPPTCSSDQFTCGDSKCISKRWKCDGEKDCTDGLDEDPKVCGKPPTCSSDQFTCGDSKCISKRLKCDGEKDCTDGLDEDPKVCGKPSTCSSDQFTCGDSKCISKRLKCDGEKDCTDGLDEDPKVCGKPSTCSSDQFTCGDSKCISKRLRCDGEKDCTDGLDEDPKVCGKPPTCSSDQFTCGDSKCISKRWKCDGEKDCTDGLDEDPKVCGKPPTCSSDQFTCGDSKCISKRLKCDGEKDCTDGLDEDPKVCGKPSTCSSDQFTCGDSKCISKRLKCDGEKDCTDGLDEDPKVCGKPSTCSSDQFTCGDLKCIPKRWKCDSEKDCTDGLDEDPKVCGKPPTCSSDQFTCGDSKCIPKRWKCDGEKDCTDGLDEDLKVCGKPSTCSSDQFTCGDLKCVPMRWKCDGEKDCGDGSDEDPKLCSISSIATDKSTCGLQYFQCSDSRCIPIEWKCDGKKDCYDGLDEDPKECESKKCGSYYYQCSNTRCIPITWLCDGENDCGDKSDERPRECGYSNIIKNIEMYVKPTEIISGDKVTLYCNYNLIQNEPIFSVKWYRNNEEFYRYTPSERPIKKVFQLPNFKIDWELSNDHEIVLLDVIPEMSGNYTCEALTDAPFFIALQTTQYVSIKDKPGNVTVTVEPAEPKVGDTIWLKCNYDLKNETSLVVKWYKDLRLFYQYISGSEAKKTKLTLNSSTIDLEASNHQEVVLENVTAEASGTYTCEVSTFYSEEQASRKLSIQRVKTSPSIVLTPSSPRRGDKLSLECNYDLNGQPLYIVKWYKGVMEFYRYVPSIQPHVRVFPLQYLNSNIDLESSNDHRIVILNARPEMSGNYSCEVTTDAPLFHTSHVTKYISIKDFIPCKVKEFRCGNSKCIPTVRLCNGENNCGDESDEDPKECEDSRGLDEVGLDVPASVNVNESVTLQCNYNLKVQSPYLVKWYKDGQEFYRYTLNRVPQGSLTQSRGFKLNLSTSNDHQVVLEHIQEKASGNYSCKVKSFFSTKMATAVLNVTIPVTQEIV